MIEAESESERVILEEDGGRLKETEKYRKRVTTKGIVGERERGGERRIDFVLIADSFLSEMTILARFAFRMLRFVFFLHD